MTKIENINLYYSFDLIRFSCGLDLDYLTFSEMFQMFQDNLPMQEENFACPIGFFFIIISNKNALESTINVMKQATLS